MADRVEFLAADWPAPEGVIAGTTLRAGGASSGAFASLNLGAHVGDDPDSVAENRRRVHDQLALPGAPQWLRQVHGRDVVDAPLADPEPEADASVTTRAGTVCAVLTADCLPVLLTSRDGAVIAAAHAGWRGLLAGILPAAVAAMRVAPSSLLAWLGPAIAQPAFEVGAEVREGFVAADGETAACFAANARGRWQADLYALARRSLERAGVAAVYGGGRCTHAESAAFFSHRRDGHCGRMASLIYRAP